MFGRVRTVETGERLHGEHARQGLVYIHRVQQGLVVPGLELVGNHENPVRIRPDLLGDCAGREPVQARLSDLDALVVVLTRERHDRLVRALPGSQRRLHGMEVLDAPGDGRGDDHRPGLPSDLLLGEDLAEEVVDHDVGLLCDRVLVPFDVGTQLLRGSPSVELRIVLDGLHELVVAADRGVVGQHIDDEALLDGLLHRVGVERSVPSGAVRVRDGLPEHLQRLVLRGRGERKVARVGQQLLGFDDPVDLILDALLLIAVLPTAECTGDRRRRLRALRGVGFIDHDREAAPLVLCADVVEDVGELLDRGDDDLLASRDRPAQVTGTVRVHQG